MVNAPTRLKDAIKRVPGVQTLYFRLSGMRLPRSTEAAFREIVSENKWGVNESLSGGGSDLHQTRIVRERLPALWAELSVTTVLDIPCGDFFWMKHVPKDGIHYLGADILPELIESNNKLYRQSDVNFQTLNLLEGGLPKVDFILCRDCLMHFSYRHAITALRNICESGSTYLLTTTFTDRRRNHDIATGQFRPLNLQARPIALPPPMLLINEGCTEYEGAYPDKSLGLWRTADIRAHLERRH
ncbi:methyltransferase domain-containing protein [Mycolicibacterium iranicum]|uniref:Methyltransferase type 11 domain-containing protein n=1 Tax=Mycolicibacterium iranicum TaxID=912594 RepID=A0ABT4HIX7_MYCIR|nr:methyltransferase domain-containing protein [Mycolicibacterium iranicum]MCZ0730125.1 hypothetical protein [Mycolicibacterium iranicum]